MPLEVSESLRLCEFCSYPMGPDVTRRAKYHRECRDKAGNARWRLRKKLEAEGKNPTTAEIDALVANQRPKVSRLLTTDITEATQLRWRLSPDPTNELQHVLARTGLYAQWASDELSGADIALMVDAHPTQVSRALTALRDLTVELATATEWEPHRVVTELLYRNEMPDPGNTEACWEWARRGTEAFLQFEARYFIMPSRRYYIRKAFHRNWITEILFAYATGGYLQIMAPPRHGKSQLLVHFCCWLICRNPNIRIMWVGPNEEISSLYVWAVASELETNERLITETSPAGSRYAPAKRGSGADWTKKHFTVTNRDVVLVGATMSAVGRGGKMLSRNCDIIIVDDPEDLESVKLPSSRSGTRRWFSQILDSRKEEHTALVVLGSRQDFDDLYGYNMTDPNFRSVVDRAHKRECVIPEGKTEAHVECVLFPEVRTFKWLMSKKYGMRARSEDKTDASMYELVYNNDVTSGATGYWTRELIAPSLNPMRRLGLDGIPKEGRVLVGGLDPAATGYQAAFLWAFTPWMGEREVVLDAEFNHLAYQDMGIKRWMVDLENRRGGGVEEAKDIMERWLADYGCAWWVVENMAMQKIFTSDPRIRFWARSAGVEISGHSTNANKYDARFGLGAMARYWAEPLLVDLPYGDEEARAATDQYINQLLSFDGSVGGERTRTKDLHMASWFPMKIARRLEKELAAAATGPSDRSGWGWDPSFPEITTFSEDLDVAPW